MQNLIFTVNNIDSKQISIFVSVIICIISLLILLISLLIYGHNEKHYHDLLNDYSASLRVFVVDLKNDSVKFFNRSNLKKQRASSITDFYNQFPASERERLINWIAQLLEEGEHAVKSIEINVLTHHNRRSYFTILIAEKVDVENSIIHLESYILPYISLKRRNNPNSNLTFSTREGFSHALLNANSAKGITFAINLYDKRNHRADKESFPQVIFSQVKDILTNYLTPTRFMLENSDHEILISDLKATTRSKALQIINSIKEVVNRHLIISSFADDVASAIGVVENKYFASEPDKLIKNALKLAEMAKDDDDREVVWFERGMSEFVDDIGDYTYRTEVERIIRDKKLAYTFRLVYDIKRLKPFGYLSSATPVDTIFSTIKELKNYAVKTEDDKELFGTIAKNIISTFIGEKYEDNLRLFFNIRFSEKPNVMKTLSHIAHIKETHIVLVLEESDLNDLVVNRDDIIANDLHSLKVKGYELALSLNDAELTFTSRVYALFDFFIINGVVTKGVKTDSRARLKVHGLIEKLLPFGRDIIASNVANWADTELLIKLGISLLSSEVISPSNVAVTPIGVKSENKLKAIASQGARRNGK